MKYVKTSVWKFGPMSSYFNGLLVEYPTPSNISYMWNFGFCLGLLLVNQILTGFFLSCNYVSSEIMAFDSVMYIVRDLDYGWIVRDLHANGASFFFFCIYMHIARGIYYSSYSYTAVWAVGVAILFLAIVTAFVGYVLVWGQMSYWAATVITNLLSVIPMVGEELVCWVWGGYSVCEATLNRFFAIHFICPFLMTFLVMVHLILLHETGSNNPDGCCCVDYIPFFPYFIYKDLFGILLMYTTIFMVIFFQPRLFQEPENFMKANPLVTPVHIKPEWYFLPAYAVLRSIPNKIAGVVGLVAFYAILLILPYIDSSRKKSLQYLPMCQVFFWWWCGNILILTWLGAKLAEPPFAIASVVSMIFYFVGVFIFVFIRYVDSKN